MKLEKERLLVISPHPDDEVLGCGGLINKIKRNGGSVFIQFMTLNAYDKIGGGKVKKEIWKKELEKTVKFLKIDDYDFSPFIDKMRYLDMEPQADLIDYLELSSKLSISKLKPTIVAIPTIFSNHQDHIQIYKISISALRPHPQKTNYLPKFVISYESPEYYFWSPYIEFGNFSPNFYVPLTSTEIKIKTKALSIYKSQLYKGKRDFDKVISLAKIRGSEVGVDFAEAFHIHRMFI